MAGAARQRGNRGKHPSKKIRLRVVHILVAVLIFAVALLLSAARLARRNVATADSSDETALGIAPPRAGRSAAAARNASATPPATATPFHFVVSSDCTSYQRWEVLTQLHSAGALRQRGRFTWIVSGCLAEGAAGRGRGKGGAGSDVLTRALLLEVAARHFPRLTASDPAGADGAGPAAARAPADACAVRPHVHFTPDYSDMSAFGGPFADGTRRRAFVNRRGKVLYGSYGSTYKFNNKPNGLHHWAVDFLARDARRDEAVVLIDPDFLFLRRFELPPEAPPVRPGAPAAAKYGLGAQFLEFNLTRICDRARPAGAAAACPFVSLSSRDVNRYYSAGPPYVIHVRDVLALSARWSALVPPTYDEYPLLYAEMFAYSMAAADLGLKHHLIQDLFTGCMTGWPTDGTRDEEQRRAVTASAVAFANSAAAADNDGGAATCFLPPLTPPPFLHYCARYTFVTPYPSASERSSGSKAPKYHFFAKRRVEHDIFDCGREDERLTPFLSTKREKVHGGSEDWNVITACAVVRAINFAKKRATEGNCTAPSVIV